MENNYSEKSLLEIAFELTEASVDGYEINELLDKVLSLKGIDVNDIDARSTLYIDICSSSKFVYLDSGKWDLKTRHSLEEYDKDGSKLYTQEELDEIEEDLDEDDDDEDLDDEEDDDEDDEDLDEDDDEDDNYGEDSYSDSSEDDDYIDDDSDDIDLDEKKYNDIMDEYEDKYDR
jgi:DNA-directed RNA polymerase delta subunit